MLIRINGGLGNQLFQYALGESIRIKTGKKVEYETFSYIRDKKRKCQLDQFHINGLGNTRKISMLVWYVLARISLKTGNAKKWDSKLRILREDGEAGLYTDRPDYRYLVGYWQNEQNFSEIKKELQKQYQCKCNFEKSKEILGIIEASNAIAVHVRRGDYLQGNNQDMYAKCDEEYYRQAFGYVKQKVVNPVFIVFSNDIEWCKKNLHEENMYYIDAQYSESDVNDFVIMKSCKHFIIANSTFSWWASWLAENKEKIVIAPKNWYVDAKMNEQIGKDLLSNTIRV